MNDSSNLGQDEQRLLKQVMSQYDAPAFMRRERQVHEAYEQLQGQCRKQRDEWLPMIRTRLALVFALAGDPARLQRHLADEQDLVRLHKMVEELQPRLRSPVEPASSPRTLRQALLELNESVERFNQRWCGYLEQVDLTIVNQLREGYNRYFLLEKECAVRSARVARMGYRPLTPLTIDDLWARWPLLPVMRVR